MAEFTVNLAGGLQAQVSVDYESNVISTVITDIQVSERFMASIKEIGQFDGELVPEMYRSEVACISKNLHDATKRVVSLIKYYLGHAYISEQLFSMKETKWGESIDCPYYLPNRLFASGSVESSKPLRSDTISHVQSALDNNLLPLIAMRHLHRARSEEISHHKWIDATIAAELAVKEVLAKAHPQLEPLLMEIPSPPLSKLYGVILEEYMGEKSPYLKQIRNGVEVRNRLIHRPEATVIDQQEANDYVVCIEAAIFHLLHRLYPDELLINDAYR